jgi:hypothetical protein
MTIEDVFIFEEEEILNPNDVERELLPDSERYAVIFTGGTMTDAEHQKFRYGSKHCSIHKDNLTEDEAKSLAKRWNSILTPGEKKYYRMKYSAVLSVKIKEY